MKGVGNKGEIHPTPSTAHSPSMVSFIVWGRVPQMLTGRLAVHQVSNAMPFV